MAWTNIPNLTTYDSNLGAGDWQYDEATKKIRHAAGTWRTTVNALYSALMDLADNADFMDSDVPMKANTPTEYELINGWTMDAAADYGYLRGGSIKDNANNDLWANFYNLGTIKSGTVIYIEQNGSLVASPPGYVNGDMDVLVRVVQAGTAIDSRKVSFFARNLGDTYDVFTIAAPATGGRNPIPISTSTDLNDDPNTASNGGITIAFGSVTKDIGDGAGAQPYDVVINGNGLSVAALYKAIKYVTRRQNTSAIGTGNSTPGRFYRAVSSGYPEVKNSPFGYFAGGKIFGARGVWIENVSDPNNISVIDSNGVTRVPPTMVSVQVTGLVAGDRVFVARTSGGVINKNQFTISSTTASSITVSAAIPADIPTSGVVRIGDVRFTYTGKSGSTFSGVSPSPSGYTGTCYVPLIDDVAAGATMASSFQYVTDFDVVARVRKKGILPFENTATVSSSGASVSAIRTPDTIVS